MKPYALGAACLLIVAIQASHLVKAKTKANDNDDDARLYRESLANDIEVKRQLKYEDWAPIHYQAYRIDGGFQKPEETLKLLKQLQEIYKPFTNEETNGRKEKINRLIDASNMDPRLCTRKNLQNFDELIEYHLAFRKTIVVYLGSYFLDFVKICEERVLHNLREDVQMIKEEFRNDIGKLIRITIEAEIGGVVLDYGHVGKLWIYTDHMVEGILRFLEGKFGDQLSAETYVKPKDGKAKFRELFEHHIVDMCSTWVHVTDPIDALTHYDIFLKFEEDEGHWIINGLFCRLLERGEQKIFAKLYRRFKRHVTNSNIKGFFRKLVGIKPRPKALESNAQSITSGD